MACLTSVIEPLRAANEIAGSDRFAWELISEKGGKVMSSAQVGFETTSTLAAAEGLDVLILLSSPNAVFSDPRSTARLRAMARHGLPLGGISGGVFPLCRAGVMQNHRCSVHWCYETAFRAEFPQIAASDEVVITERARLTASGAAAAFDLALHLIDLHFDAEVTFEVACWFQHASMRGAGVRQRIPAQEAAGKALPGMVGRAVDLFAQHMEETISIADVAAHLGVTPRQVERAFKAATGDSPSHYYRAMRMKAARQLVLYSNDNLGEIAQAVGYASAGPLTRHYEAAFGVSPRADRAKINSFRVNGNVPLPST